MLTAIHAMLSGDATLLATLTGGVYQTPEISRQTTPAAFDANKELLPCALVKASTAAPYGPHQQSGQLFVQVYFYERHGYASIETARRRVYALLHRSQLTPVSGDGCYDIRHAGDVLGQQDSVLGSAMIVSRFVATIQRR